MNEDIREYVDRLVAAQGDKIVSIILIGSKMGAYDPTESDLDLLVVCEYREDIPSITRKARQLETEVFGVEHSWLVRNAQKYLLGTPAFTGIDLLVVPLEEFDADMEPRSTRAKVLTGLVLSRSVFMYNIKHQGEVLYGEDLLEGISIPEPGWRDRVASFFFSFAVLYALPWAFTEPRKFKILCFKATKYYAHNMEVYARVKLRDDDLTLADIEADDSMYELAKEYRYRPEEYPGSAAGLYLRTWWGVLKNLPFIWRGAKLADASTIED